MIARAFDTFFDTLMKYLIWGTFYGGCLGLLSGTLIFPIFGSIFAAVWGSGMGMAMGVVAGILVLLSDALFRRADTDITSYRRKLSAFIGVVVAVGIIPLLVISSRGFLWDNLDPYTGSLDFFLIPSVFAAALWGGLSAAHTTAFHVDDGDSYPQERIDSTGVIGRLISAAFNRWTLLFGVVAGAAIHSINISQGFRGTPVDRIYDLFKGGLAGLMLAGFDALLLGLANGVFLWFVNRVYFKEYAPHLTLAQYKTRVSVLVFLFTCVAGLLVSAFVFVPLAGVIAVMAARHYANWLYASDEKFKGKPKEAYLPAHALETGIAPDRQITNDDETEKAVEQRR